MSDSVQALQPVVDDGLLRSIKDCTAGSVGGILQVLVGQPFDTVKVVCAPLPSMLLCHCIHPPPPHTIQRLQTAPIPRPGEPPMYASTMDGFRKVAAEGWGTFYKGTTTPLLGVGLCVSIQFVVLEDLKRRFAHANLAAGSAPALTTSQLYTAGALAGLANSVVSGPVEHIRTRLQVQSSSHPLYSGPGDCIKQIWRAHGLPGLYKAQATTALRELQGYGAYFALYETLVQRECAASGKPREDLDTWRVCTYGALAGYAMWFTIYPIVCGSVFTCLLA
jgi:solute carrier family 25 carnitine/acylcarnitine transporter 20/29